MRRRKLLLLISSLVLLTVFLSGCGGSKYVGHYVIQEYRIAKTGEVFTKETIKEYDEYSYLFNDGILDIKNDGSLTIWFRANNIKFSGNYEIDGNEIYVYEDEEERPFARLDIINDTTIELDSAYNFGTFFVFVFEKS